MSYLIDTNVISEMSKTNPNKAVSDWIKSTPETELYLSVITIGEIILGIQKLSEKTRRSKLSSWLNELISVGFTDRILDINIGVMQAWGKMFAILPRSLPIQDTFIAATAIAHNLTVVTRNIRDFNCIPGLSIINPWEV